MSFGRALFGAVALMQAMSPTAALAQTRDRADATLPIIGTPAWHASGDSLPSPGLAFACTRGMTFNIDGVAGPVTLDKAIVIPNRRASGAIELLVIPEDLIVSDRTARRLAYEEGRSFAQFNRSYTVETTNNLAYDPALDRTVTHPNFAANAAAGRAAVALPARMDANGMVHVDTSVNGGRAYSPNMNIVAQGLGQRMLIQPDRMGVDRLAFEFAPHAVCD